MIHDPQYVLVQYLNEKLVKQEVQTDKNPAHTTIWEYFRADANNNEKYDGQWSDLPTCHEDPMLLNINTNHQYHQQVDHYQMNRP